MKVIVFGEHFDGRKLYLGRGNKWVRSPQAAKRMDENSAGDFIWKAQNELAELAFRGTPHPVKGFGYQSA